MTPSYRDDWLTIYGGDCRTVLAEMPAESVHCVVTSPPYWGLRDYGTATWEGGEEGCDHIAGYGPGREGRETPGGRGGSFPMSDVPYRDTCGKCGAVRIDSQLGLEPTPEQYVENMVAVFREVRRVLRSDGTVWLNLGDSYANTGVADPSKVGGFTGERIRAKLAGLNPNDSAQDSRPRAMPAGLKPKDLVGIPWRVAFALQADGWYLRSDIIWSKPNPMPESVTDRPTKSHEYLFLLAKSPRYYFDADAVREEPAGEYLSSGVRNPRHGRVGGLMPWEQRGDSINARTLVKPSGNGVPEAGRNIRTVWTVATQPYPGAHFAVFPEKLIEPCILAGTSERGVCPECGKPWRRVIERERAVVIADAAASGNTATRRHDVLRKGEGRTVTRDNTFIPRQATRTLWIPSCAHDAEPVGAVVLDPFGGSGTTARVANRLSRRAVLIDLNPEYLKQQMDRNRDIPLGLGA